MKRNRPETIHSASTAMAKSTTRRKGYVLLLVIMVMIVLTLLALEFQQESVIQLQMNKHRQSMVQCEYALESGLVAAGKLIQEYNDDMINRIRKRQPAQSAQDLQEEDEVPKLTEDMKKLDPEQFSSLIDQVSQIAADNNDIVITEMIKTIDLENLDLEVAAPVLAGIMTIAEDNGLEGVTDLVNDLLYQENGGTEIDYDMMANIINEIGLTAQENSLDDITALLDDYNQITDPNIDDINSALEQIETIATENGYEDIISTLELTDQAIQIPGETSSEAIPQEWLEHLLKKQSIDIGDATVDIYIYGENYKLPLVWAMKSQFGRSSPRENNYNMPLVKSLIDELDPGSPNTQQIIDYLAELTDGIEIPFSPGVYMSNNLWRRRSYGTTNRMVELWVTRNHINFAPVGGQWHRDVNNIHYQDIKDMVTLPSGNMLSDYLGIWGSTYININTAPVEVLTVGLKDIGITPEIAQKIVDWRESNSLFLSPRDVRQVDGIDNNMAAAIFYLTKVVDNVFTVRIVASIGDITKTKQACYHRRGTKLQLQAVY